MADGKRRARIVYCRPSIGKGAGGQERLMKQHKETFEKVVDADIEIMGVPEGPEWTTSHFDEAFIARGLLERAAEAERKGYNVFIPGTVSDPAIHALREAFDKILIVPPGEATLVVAMLLANKIVWVGTNQHMHGYNMKLKSMRRLGIPAERVIFKETIDPDLIISHPDDPAVQQKMVDLAVAEIKKAVDEEGAELAVIGSTDFSRHGTTAAVKKRLEAEGYPDIPVLDPGTIVMKVGQMMAEMGLVQSKRAFPRPKGKQYFIKGRWVDDPLA